MNLLLIEDETKLSDAISYLLKKNGYAVEVAADGESGLEMAINGKFDIIVLDRMLPRRDGLSVLQELRKLSIHTPVIFLSAKDTPEDRVEGLNAGADDYLVKPFFSDELVARLRALSRRKDKDLVENTFNTASFFFDPMRCEVRKESEIIQLTAKESLLLGLLMHNYGHVLTKQRIIEIVWGYNSDVDFANVELYIHYLRKKLKTSCIKTVRGIGYYFQEDDNVPTVTT